MKNDDLKRNGKLEINTQTSPQLDTKYRASSSKLVNPNNEVKISGEVKLDDITVEREIHTKRIIESEREITVKEKINNEVMPEEAVNENIETLDDNNVPSSDMGSTNLDEINNYNSAPLNEEQNNIDRLNSDNKPPKSSPENNLQDYNKKPSNIENNNSNKLNEDSQKTNIKEEDKSRLNENKPSNEEVPANNRNYQAGKQNYPQANEQEESSLPRQRFNNQTNNVTSTQEQMSNEAVQNKINDQKKRNELAKENKASENKKEEKPKEEKKPSVNRNNNKEKNKKDKAEENPAEKLKKFKIKLIIFGIAFFFLIFFLIIIGMLAGDEAESSAVGYYNGLCNYNEANVSIGGENLPLKEYVLGATSYYDNGFNDEALKALMIILKTNALSYGNYSSSNKNISLDSSFNYKNDDVSNYESIYEQISGKLYLSSNYQTQIQSLNANDSLDFNDDILNKIKSLSESGKTYEDILRELYKNTVSKTSTNNIFVGDSRTVNFANFTSSDNVIAKVSGNYSYFTGDASSALNSKLNSQSNSNVYFLFGINDLHNVKNYFHKYQEFAQSYRSHNFYVVNVGPVDETKCENITNAQVNSFNYEMSNLIASAGLSNLKYLKITYNITSYDSMGVHYASSDYQNIYQSLVGNNASSSSSPKIYELYELSNYCTFYNYSSSTSFWWPVGSANETSSGIYGGTPTATTITSGFGPRVIEGKSSNHTGIDISGGSNCFANVIIASKGGTVVEAKDSCATVGSYGNNCNGGYGNYIIIDHGDGFQTVYAHMTSGSVAVSVGSSVSQGQKIGIMGSSGSSTGCHVHFEIRQDGTKVNPADYVSASNARPAEVNINASVTGNSNTQTICLTLKAQGYSNNAVSAIMTNMEAESGFSPTSLGDHGTSYGLCQWHNGRYDNLKNYCGGNYSNIDCQLNYLSYELQKSYPSVYTYIRSNNSANSMAYYYCYNFEIPAARDTSCQKRADNYSQKYLNYANNNCN